MANIFQKDIDRLGVMVKDNLKPNLQCARTAGKANGVLGRLSRAVLHMDSNTLIRLNLVYVRPIFEYCIQAVGPYTVADKLCLERVQMRAVRMVSDISGGTYTEKLAKLKMTTLEERRRRGDMIQTWRILTGKDMVLVTVGTWFDFEVDRKREGATTTRNASQHHAIRPREFSHDDRGMFFSNRVVKDYNALPEYVKLSTNINTFKNNLDLHRGTPSRTGSKPNEDRLRSRQEMNWGKS